MKQRVDTRMVLAEIHALLRDDNPHERAELRALVAAYGGCDRHWRKAIQKLKRHGFYVAHNRTNDRYYHARTTTQVQAATANAVTDRAMSELITRVRAARGEHLRMLKRGDDIVGIEARIATWEGVLSSMALAVGRTPLNLLSETLLSAMEESEILAEFD